MLKKVNNRWALVSTSKPGKVLKWFGKTKPSSASVTTQEKRVQYFKNKKKGGW